MSTTRANRAEWLSKIAEAGVRRRAELYYQQLDALVSLRQQARRKLLAESKKDSAWKLLRSIPALGPIRVALLLGIVQTPHRFRSKRPLWRYRGLGVVTHRSADHRYVEGQRERSKKPVLVRGLDPITITISRTCSRARRPRPPPGRVLSGSSTKLWWPKG